MKKTSFKNLTLTLVLLTAFIGFSYAQPGNGNRANGNRGNFGQNRFENIPNLTDTQKTSLETMRTTHMKEMLPLRNELREKQAHLKTISSGENVDMTKVNKQIEDIGVLRLKQAKNRAKHHQEVRSILTADQRVWFDAHKYNGKRHNKRRGGGQRNMN